MIYRTSMEVRWDEARHCLYSPRPGKRSYLEWFKQIVRAVRAEYGFTLQLDPANEWKNVPPALQAQIRGAAPYRGSALPGGKRMRMWRVALLIPLAFTLSSPVQAKRLGPDRVEAVEHKGVRYEAPHWGRLAGRDQNGGYVEAYDARNNALLWVVRVYEVEYDASIEKDVQDVFITSMEVRGDILFIRNEKGSAFGVNLENRQVERIQERDSRKSAAQPGNGADGGRR